MCRKNAGYGRIEKRNCTVVSYGSIMEKMFKEKLVGLKSVVRIKSERTIVATGEYTQEVRYYVTSLDNTRPEKIASVRTFFREIYLRNAGCAQEIRRNDQQIFRYGRHDLVFFLL